MNILSIKKILIFISLIAIWSCDEDEGDTTPPELSITSPQTGSIVNQIVSITCEASDNDKVEFVKFFVNDSLDSFIVSAEPYIFEWNTNNLQNETYSIKAIAEDASGNSSESSAINLIVDNSLSIPNSVNIENISYSLNLMTIRFRQSNEDDFKNYKLFVSSSSDSNDIFEIGEITDKSDTVFTTSDFDPTQRKWYFVMVTDIYGYSILGSGYSVLDSNPTEPFFQSPNYNNGIIRFAWSASPDNDFLRYYLYSSNSEDMEGKTVLSTNTVRNDTTHTMILNLTESIKYYQVIVEDQWGFFSESNIAQPNLPFTMIKNYGGIQDERGYAIEETNDGGYILIGSTTSYGAGGSDVWILKIDAAGIFEWSRTIGGIEDDVGRAIMQTSDGGYIATGYTKSFSDDGNMDLWLIKTDASGQICIYSEDGNCSDGTSMWVKTFGTSGNDYGNSVIESIENDSTYFIVVGKSGRIPSVYMIKTDDKGQKIWENLYGAGPGGKAQYIIESIGQSPRYIVVGQDNHTGTPDSDLVVAGININGEAPWFRSIQYGNGLNEIGNFISRLSSGGYIVAGAKQNGNWDDILVMKANNDGTQADSWIFGGSDNESGTYVQESEDGFIISGFTESFGQGFYDIWIIKTDDNGNEIYTQTFGGNMDDRALGGDKGSNGEPLIIGYTSSFGNGGEDILFIKIDPNYQP